MIEEQQQQQQQQQQRSSMLTDTDDSSFYISSCSSDESLIRESAFLPVDPTLAGAPPYKYHLYQMAALAVKCQHNQMPLSVLHRAEKSTGLWLPYVAMKECFKLNKVVVYMAEFFAKELTIPLPFDRKKTMAEMNAITEATSGNNNNSSTTITTPPSVPFERVQLHTITRIQLPNGEFITRVVYVAKWKSSDRNCCRNSAHIKWIPITLAADSMLGGGGGGNSGGSGGGSGGTTTSIKTVASGIEEKSYSNKAKRTEYGSALVSHFWGIEVCKYANFLKTMRIDQLLQVHEITTSDVFKYAIRDGGGGGNAPIGTNGETQTSPSPSPTIATKHTHRTSPRSVFGTFLLECGYTEMDVVKIYCDFIQHCYPSTTMSVFAFVDYCNKIGLIPTYLDTNTVRNIFKAINYKEKHYIGFNEFLLGIGIIDPAAPHCKARYSYIFRYYDADSDGYLDRLDLRRLLIDIHNMSAGKIDNKELFEQMQQPQQQKWNYDTFVEAIEVDKMKGTTLLLRTPKSLLELMNEVNAYHTILTHRCQQPFGPAVLATCVRCRPKNYSLAVHTVRLGKTGRIEEARPLIGGGGGGTADVTKCTQTELSHLQYFPSHRVNYKQRHSIEYVFNINTSAHFVLGLVRKMYGYNRMPDDRRKEVRQAVVAGLTTTVICGICDQVIDIFSTESRVLQVSTPTFVLGDIHGNVNDLLTLEEQLWPLAPACNAPNVLFLGDYVDRGDFSIEVICYLFAMKILAPNKFKLLRGNHEVRGIQRLFTFERECKEKYGNNGLLVFETLNRAFDYLPFAAVIDEQIYCAHGGIPCSAMKIEELLSVPSVVQDPENESPMVWEIVWSDPISESEYQQLCEFQFNKQRKDNELNGFVPNTKRSTAYYFSETATMNFLKANNLTYVIRAHEVIDDGYKFNHHGQVITVFSCSNYCSGTNKAAAILVEGFESEGYIKIISCDT